MTSAMLPVVYTTRSRGVGYEPVQPVCSAVHMQAFAVFCCIRKSNIDLSFAVAVGLFGARQISRRDTPSPLLLAFRQSQRQKALLHQKGSSFMSSIPVSLPMSSIEESIERLLLIHVEGSLLACSFSCCGLGESQCRSDCDGRHAYRPDQGVGFLLPSSDYHDTGD